MKIAGIIPARYASSRLPGKALLEIGEKSIIRRVYEQCDRSGVFQELLVATDDHRILDHVEAFGGKAVLTDLAHQSGTERCAEVAGDLAGFDAIINVQGDEPFIDPGQIERVAELLRTSVGVPVVTLATRIRDTGQLFNSNVVKVVFNSQNRAIYFSRSPVPYLRDIPQEEWVDKMPYYKHVGMYGYHRLALLELVKLPPSPLEGAEKLEQLRWLEHGYEIAVGVTPLDSFGIDTPEDLAQARRKNMK